MKLGNIYKVSYNNYGYEGEFVGILADIREDVLTFITEKGRMQKLIESKILKKGYIRNYLTEARDLFKKRYTAYKEEMKIKEKINNLNKELQSISKDFNSFEEDMQHAKGLMTYAEFSKTVFENITKNVKDELERYDYEFETPYGIPYNEEKNLYISRNVDIEKWFRSASFLYEEYDGTIHFTSDYEKDKNYQSILRRYSRPLSVKMKFIETLALGDKDWLSYHATYEIPLKKPLTKEYAKEIANKYF